MSDDAHPTERQAESTEIGLDASVQQPEVMKTATFTYPEELSPFVGNWIVVHKHNGPEKCTAVDTRGDFVRKCRDHGEFDLRYKQLTHTGNVCEAHLGVLIATYIRTGDIPSAT